MPLTLFQPVLLTSCKVPFFHKFSFHISPYFLYECIRLINVFVISLFILPKMTPAGAESTWGKSGAFLNSFYPDVKRITRSLNWSSIKLAETKCLFYLIKHVWKRKRCWYIYVYITVCICVCICHGTSLHGNGMDYSSSIYTDSTWLLGKSPPSWRLVGWVLWQINLCRLFNAKLTPM